MTGRAASASRTFGEGDHVGLRGPGPDESELVAGETCQHVDRALVPGDPPSELDQQFVAGVVAEGVVHLLEPVEVEHHHEADTVARAVLRDLGDLLLERRPVRAVR